MSIIIVGVGPAEFDGKCFSGFFRMFYVCLHISDMWLFKQILFFKKKHNIEQAVSTVGISSWID